MHCFLHRSDGEHKAIGSSLTSTWNTSCVCRSDGNDDSQAEQPEAAGESDAADGSEANSKGSPDSDDSGDSSSDSGASSSADSSSDGDSADTMESEGALRALSPAESPARDSAACSGGAEPAQANGRPRR